MNAALLLVDIQNDFLPGGALAVPDGDQVIQPALELANHVPLVFATQDWHPRDHGSFAANHDGAAVGEVTTLNGLSQMLWPVHCVQNQSGAEFAPPIAELSLHHVSRKGNDATVDSYSGFFDNAKLRKTDLDERLKAAGVATLFVCGLATEYCVKHTVLDALELGYETFLVLDACRGISPADCEAAVREMEASGAKVIATQDVPSLTAK